MTRRNQNNNSINTPQKAEARKEFQTPRALSGNNSNNRVNNNSNSKGGDSSGQCPGQEAEIVNKCVRVSHFQETSSRPVLPCVQGSQPGQLRVIAIYNYLHISIIIRVFGACVAGCAKRCPAKK